VEKPPPRATRVHLEVSLGHDVEVRRDQSLRLWLTGNPTLDVTNDVQVSGQIALLPNGVMSIQGKRFLLDRGTVDFTGQAPANPIVVATAHYDAPDGTRVFADFTGPMKTGKVVLRSEPAHTQDEILAILLFGSPEGAFGASAPPGRGPSAAATASGAVGNFVAQGINRALQGIAPVEVATRVETGEEGSPKPELEVQLSKDVSVQATYSTGTPGPGQNPDRTLLMLSWRFVRQWVLETTVGDRGSSWVDVLWNFRY
jgi:translocation and assembly module TamB